MPSLILSDDHLMEVYKLKTLIRYNNRLRLTNESVAEHSFFVTLFVFEICDILEIDEVLKARCIEYALLHDISETILSDIPANVKRLSPAIAEMLKKYEHAFMLENYPKHALLGEDPTISLIVKLADLYSVRQYCLVEKSLGNQTLDFIDYVNVRIDELEEKIVQKFGKK